MVARLIHHRSAQREMPLIKVNCAAIPDTLLESELFGHVRGAFTGATMTKRGKFALADGGSIFLDEIGTMSPAIQSKLLRVLQEREFEPLGAERTQKVDVRVIAATNRDLKQMVSDGKFQEDLYYRLNVIPIEIPPLRERREDIPVLVEHFVEKHRQRTGKKIERVDEGVIGALERYDWPGNVRELENTIERAVLLSGGEVIEPRDLPAKLQGFGAEPRTGPRLGDQGTDLRKAVETFENGLIRQALERTNWNKKRAAELLGINRTTLVEMLKRKRIDAA
jgi:transcriptional regulator with GAF, ATPase, and Fis domain